MTKLKKLFGQTEMTWKLVIIFSLASGFITALLMIPDFLEGTSFRQPGISYEYWVLAAMFIILNCKTPMEAGLKTMVFFLISQPLIYLVQVPFSWQGWGLFHYYKLWFILTLLTLPGGFVAWYTKKGNWLSVLILSVANCLLCMELSYFIFEARNIFPKLTITILFIIAMVIFFVLLLFEDRKKRLAAFLIAAVMFAFFVVSDIKALHPVVTYLHEIEGSEPYTVISKPEDAEVTFSNGYMRVSTANSGDFSFEIQDSEGNIYRVQLSIEDGESDFVIEKQ